MNLVGSNRAVNRGATGAADVGGVARHAVAIGSHPARMVASVISHYRATGAGGLVTLDAVASGGITILTDVVNRGSGIDGGVTD